MNKTEIRLDKKSSQSSNKKRSMSVEEVFIERVLLRASTSGGYLSESALRRIARSILLEDDGFGAGGSGFDSYSGGGLGSLKKIFVDPFSDIAKATGNVALGALSAAVIPAAAVKNLFTGSGSDSVVAAFDAHRGRQEKLKKAWEPILKNNAKVLQNDGAILALAVNPQVYLGTLLGKEITKNTIDLAASLAELGFLPKGLETSWKNFSEGWQTRERKRDEKRRQEEYQKERDSEIDKEIDAATAALAAAKLTNNKDLVEQIKNKLENLKAKKVRIAGLYAPPREFFRSAKNATSQGPEFIEEQRAGIRDICLKYAKRINMLGAVMQSVDIKSLEEKLLKIDGGKEALDVLLERIDALKRSPDFVEALKTKKPGLTDADIEQSAFKRALDELKHAMNTGALALRKTAKDAIRAVLPRPNSNEYKTVASTDAGKKLIDDAEKAIGLIDAVSKSPGNKITFDQLNEFIKET